MSDAFVLTEGVRTVLDTNTVMALWHFSDPALPCLKQAAESGRLRLLSDPDCFEELRRVLAYPRFELSAERQAELLAAYAVRCEMCTRAPLEDVLPECRDKDDQKFVELAWRADAGLIVSRDKAVLRICRHRRLREHFTAMTPERLEILLRA